MDFRTSTKTRQNDLAARSCLFECFFRYEKAIQTLENCAKQGLLLLVAVKKLKLLVSFHYCSFWGNWKAVSKDALPDGRGDVGHVDPGWVTVS